VFKAAATPIFNVVFVFQERLNEFKNCLDRAAFYILPFLFLVFNTAYWTLYLTVIVPDKTTITD